MKIALTEWQGRISPVFDVAVQAKIYETVDMSSKLIKEIDFADYSGEERIQVLSNEGIDRLICGAISDHLERFALMNNIQVISFISGEVDEVLNHFKEQRCNRTVFNMPGCRGRRNRQGRCMRRNK